MDEKLYWHCAWCGDHEALTAEDAENGYELGDKERCISCGEGTHYVWPSDICAAFGQLRALGVDRSAAIHVAQDRYTDVRKARAEGEKALGSAVAAARAEAALAEREACAEVLRAAARSLGRERDGGPLDYDCRVTLGHALRVIRARTTPATLSTETLAAIAEARGLRVVEPELLSGLDATEHDETSERATCSWCEKTAVCAGNDEGDPWALSCDEHCAHGGESGSHIYLSDHAALIALVNSAYAERDEARAELEGLEPPVLRWERRDGGDLVGYLPRWSLVAGRRMWAVRAVYDGTLDSVAPVCGLYTTDGIEANRLAAEAALRSLGVAFRVEDGGAL